MKEIEIRILEINVEEWVNFLESHGATFVGEWTQKRKVYDFKPREENRWIRLRTNGNNTTLTIKEVVDSTKIDGTQELEIEVSNFEKTAEILEELGYYPRSFQENKRIRYLYQGVEFDIDSWPLIPTYVELESDDANCIEEVISSIPMDTQKKTTKGVREIYHDFYGICEEDYCVLTFQEQVK